MGSTLQFVSREYTPTETGDFKGLKAYDHAIVDAFGGPELDKEGNPLPPKRVNELEVCFKLAENEVIEPLQICSEKYRMDNYDAENKVMTVVNMKGGWCVAASKGAVIVA